MDIISLNVSLISGAAGGNILGALIKKISLGVLGNSIAGILGGGIGSQILGGLLGGSGSGLLGNVLGSGVGGGVLMVIIGIIKNMVMKR